MLKSKTALVTGCSKGLGKAICFSLVREGITLACHYFQNRNLAMELKREIIKEKGEAFIFQADLTDPSQIRKLIKKVKEKLGKIDILINNFGPFIYKPLNEIEYEEWEYIIRANLNSAFLCCKEVLPLMRKNKWGRIINIGFSKVELLTAFPNITPYAISKTGLLILTRTLARIEAPYNITVNMVSPGLMEEGIKPEKFTIPAGRLGKFEDITELIIFLLSEKANYINGANIISSGGWF